LAHLTDLKVVPVAGAVVVWQPSAGVLPLRGGHSLQTIGTTEGSRALPRERRHVMTDSKKHHSLLNAPSVEAWIEDNEPGGIEKLHSATDRGKITGARARFVSTYLWSRNPAPMTAEEARAVVRDKRATGVAKRVLKWAFVAALFALATLLITAWSYLNEWLMWF
jgi:hypothetical protein